MRPRCPPLSNAHYLQIWVPHGLISARGVHFRGEIDTLSAYRPQKNGVVGAANKNIKRILRKMIETSRD